MEVPLIALADYANVSRENKLNVMGIFTDLYVQDFPAKHSAMVLVLQIARQIGDTSGQHTLTVKLLDQDGSPVMGLQGPIEFPKPDDSGRRIQINAIFSLHDIVFPQPGVYEFVAYVNDAELARVDLHVGLIQERK